jgi:hypothetical protein
MRPGLSRRELLLSGVLLLTGSCSATAKDGEGSRVFRERKTSAARRPEFEVPDHGEGKPRIGGRWWNSMAL